MEIDLGLLVYLLALLWPLLVRLFNKRNTARDTTQSSAEMLEDELQWVDDREPDPALPREPPWDRPDISTSPPDGRERGWDEVVPRPQARSGSYSEQRSVWPASHPSPGPVAQDDPWPAHLEESDDEGQSGVFELVPFEQGATVREKAAPVPASDEDWLRRLQGVKRAVSGQPPRQAESAYRQRAVMARQSSRPDAWTPAKARRGTSDRRAAIRDAVVLSAAWSPRVLRRRP